MDRNDLLGFRRTTLFGIPVMTSRLVPDELPKIQVRELRLKDGTLITTPEFLARENAWWLKEFGTTKVAFMMSGPFGDRFAINPKLAAMLHSYE
jgi:hypothetical protein